jgi:hypothetical protein
MSVFTIKHVMLAALFESRGYLVGGGGLLSDGRLESLAGCCESRNVGVLLECRRTVSSRLLTASMSFLKSIWRGNSKHKSEYKVILSSILMELKLKSNTVKFIIGHNTHQRVPRLISKHYAFDKNVCKTGYG